MSEQEKKTNYQMIYEKWISLAKDDLTMAEMALERGLLLQTAFHSQQSIEKKLKGLIILLKKEDPPFSHDLVKLYRILSGESFFDDHLIPAMASLNPFYIGARYPSYKEKISSQLSKESVESYLNFAKKVFLWSEQKSKS
jgi:HEPN domain-containing protein